MIVSKHERIQEFARQFSGQGVDPRYAGYFALFNQQKFYEAHDVLEDLWLADRHGPDGDFFKGLIQLAGAFVHLQKNRLRPSAALFTLARNNLCKYPERHHHLDIGEVRRLIDDWLKALEAGQFACNPLPESGPPAVNLLKSVAL